MKKYRGPRFRSKGIKRPDRIRRIGGTRMVVRCVNFRIQDLIQDDMAAFQKAMYEIGAALT